MIKKLLLLLCITTALLLVSWLHFNQTPTSSDINQDVISEATGRKLQSKEDSNPLLDEKTVEFIKTLNHQHDRAQSSEQLMTIAEKSLPYPIEITQNKSTPIHPDQHAIITCALSETYTARDAVRFLGSARKSGFTGDIVVAVLPNAKESFLGKLLYYNATIFTVGVKCEGKMNEKCQLLHQKDPSKFTFPVTFVRFFVYQTIAFAYSPHSLLFLTDFRDVFFQNNLFTQKQVLQLVSVQSTDRHRDSIMVFQEAVPNKVINRDPQTLGFINRCYGPTGVRSVAHNPVSSSGLILGHRNAVFLYTFLIIAQSNANQRVQLLQANGHLPSTESLQSLYNTQQCMSAFGVDQGFHNMLLYHSILHKYMNVIVMPQGEGPVNSLGGFFGEKKLLRAYLHQWKLLRGQSPYQYVYNWNGEISSVVHQLDRFISTELDPRLEDHLAAFQQLESDAKKDSKPLAKSK